MDRPSKMIDPASGEVDLLLIPFHLDRLHGEASPLLERHEGLPFPLLANVEPIQLHLSPGMRLEELEAVTRIESRGSLFHDAWYSFVAYGWTPFGWSRWPTPHLNRGRLSYISFDILDGGPADARFAILLQFAIETLGPADKKLHVGWARVRDVKPGERTDAYVWRRNWGSVTVRYEPRDDEPELGIAWKL